MLIRIFYYSSFAGILYAGMMLTKDGPKTLEFNCRFGDPETQVILPLLNTDLFDIVSACRDRKLNQLAIDWNTTDRAVGVIMASRGYPETSTKGCVISGERGRERGRKKETSVEILSNKICDFLFYPRIGRRACNFSYFPFRRCQKSRW